VTLNKTFKKFDKSLIFTLILMLSLIFANLSAFLKILHAISLKLKVNKIPTIYACHAVEKNQLSTPHQKVKVTTV
jgi:hypothetical protein